MSRHVDFIENEWPQGVQRRIAVAMTVVDTRSSRNWLRRLYEMFGVGSYFYCSDVHDAESCPFAGSNELPMRSLPSTDSRNCPTCGHCHPNGIGAGWCTCEDEVMASLLASVSAEDKSFMQRIARENRELRIQVRAAVKVVEAVSVYRDSPMRLAPSIEKAIDDYRATSHGPGADG